MRSSTLGARFGVPGRRRAAAALSAPGLTYAPAASPRSPGALAAPGSRKLLTVNPANRLEYETNRLDRKVERAQDMTVRAPPETPAHADAFDLHRAGAHTHSARAASAAERAPARRPTRPRSRRLPSLPPSRGAGPPHRPTRAARPSTR